MKNRRLRLHRETLLPLNAELHQVAAAESAHCESRTCSVRCKAESYCQCTILSCAPNTSCYC